MKKFSLYGLLGLSIIILGACSPEKTDKETTTIETNSKKTEITTEGTSESQNGESHSSVFKDGNFTSNAYDLSIDKTELKHNNSSDYDVLVITFTVNNKLDENIVPKELFQDLFIIKQQDETSEHQLQSEFAYQQEAAELLFPLYKTDGSSIDEPLYSENEEKQKEFDNTIGSKLEADLLPGKETQAVILVNVENSEYPVTFSLNENLPMKEKEDFVVNLN